MMDLAKRRLNIMLTISLAVLATKSVAQVISDESVQAMSALVEIDKVASDIALTTISALPCALKTS